MLLRNRCTAPYILDHDMQKSNCFIHSREDEHITTLWLAAFVLQVFPRNQKASAVWYLQVMW